ncbi:hypothetical protein [Actinotalea solisilvae]|uniref:hypothetical protein n=1 Tax=Actinotalea solisilvae TaxID=2072922 RepID=UPI0018F1570F|nr:hypothetical protein [Actinotalea solisilvae]
MRPARRGAASAPFAAAGARPRPGPVVPVTLRLDPLAAMLNAELADHPVYDGLELQWFDDDQHGTGMLAFLSRRADATVDYYVQPGLRLDRRGYEIGGGQRSWTVTEFAVARLVVTDDGVDAEVRFTDVDGRVVEVRVDDRDGRPRRRARLLAPVSAGVLRPTSLLLVWMPAFDLVRVTSTPPHVRIDGRAASTGSLPGTRLHRRHLVKYAADLVAVELNRDEDDGCDAADPPAGRPGTVCGTTAGPDGGVAAITAARGRHLAEVRFSPAMPDAAGLPDGARASGRWTLTVDGAELTSGDWSLARACERVEAGLDGLAPWRPRGLPWLMRLVTTVVPVFRAWPTTYAWRGEVALSDRPRVTGAWRRTGGHDGQGYRRATGSSTRSTR